MPRSDTYRFGFVLHGRQPTQHPTLRRQVLKNSTIYALFACRSVGWAPNIDPTPAIPGGGLLGDCWVIVGWSPNTKTREKHLIYRVSCHLVAKCWVLVSVSR